MNQISRLLNPPLLAVVASRFVRSFHDESAQGVTVALIYLAVGISLYGPLRDRVPRRKDADTLRWIREQARDVTVLGHRLPPLVPLMRQGIIAALYGELLSVDDGSIVPGPRCDAFLAVKGAQDLMKSAERVGRWFGRIGHEATVLAMFGLVA